jgi:hypothetical protein
MTSSIVNQVKFYSKLENWILEKSRMSSIKLSTNNILVDYSSS